MRARVGFNSIQILDQKISFYISFKRFPRCSGAEEICGDPAGDRAEDCPCRPRARYSKNRKIDKRIVLS